MTTPARVRPRADRVFIGTAAAIAVLVAAGAGADDRPAVLAALGLIAAATTAAMLVVSASTRWSVDHRLATSATIVVAASVTAAVLDAPATIWIGYLAVFVAASAPLTITAVAALAALPLTVLMIRTWGISGDGWSLALNAAIAVVVVVLVQMRRRQRESDDLAAAQRVVIEAQRTRAQAAQRQQVLAGQLHDVLAHTLSGLIIALQGASVAARREHAPDDVVQRLHTATQLAKDGLHEARSAVELLRLDAGDLAEHEAAVDRGAAATSLSDNDVDIWLRQTTERLRIVDGCDIAVSGTAAALPPRWLSLARSVLMEGITNSLRHAAGAPIQITITADSVQVVSVGDPAGFVEESHPSGGHGLSGLRQRVTALGGSLVAGRDCDGYRLALQIGNSPNDVRESGFTDSTQ